MEYLHPCPGAELIVPYGARRNLYRKLGQLGHNGDDYEAPEGTPVYATAAGTVLHAGWSHDHPWLTHNAGRAVLVSHTGGDEIAGYAHLSAVAVAEGQPVGAGELLGYVGHTGTAGSDHLHFERLPAVPDFGNGYAGRIKPPAFTENTDQDKDATS
ncbi:minor tail protein [Arthrobacter phage SerialPhiller]|nr:endolysin, protease M23 domain [Arthrobacter phage Kels]WNO27597.1 endolysin, protease M23 domain [Arthrobacter phage Arielagos]WNT45246.1 minor tail protein [Arthrobacter phage SerialPhiller]